MRRWCGHLQAKEHGPFNFHVGSHSTITSNNFSPILKIIKCMYVTLKSDSYEGLCLANPRVDLRVKDVNSPMINKRMKLNQEKKELVVISLNIGPGLL